MTRSKPILLCQTLAAALAIMLAAIAAGRPVLADAPLAGVATVIDGDTLEINETRIRLHGIDAPESAQLCQRPGGERWRCGKQAAVAQTAGRGIWSGAFVMPWDWRRGQRLTATSRDDARGDCRIKGNISRSGKRIYHMPGGRWYGRTRIDESRSERWFCTEEEARAAGWRRAGQ